MARSIRLKKASAAKWPFVALILVYVASLILAVVFLFGQETVAPLVFRVVLYAAASAVYWIRVTVAALRKDRDKGYYFYAALILLIPPAIWWVNCLVYSYSD